ncbi:hypothetical protein B9Z55_006064 [Caenorhabditis nigoni]|nr:hypothetical protein B9Z55_006064 [Caenorhabditis nigoni]
MSQKTHNLKDYIRENMNTQKRVIGLFNSYAGPEIKPNQFQKLTHAVFAYIQMNEDGSIGFQNNGIKERFRYWRGKARNQESDSMIPSLVDLEASAKLMISIGGHDNSQHFSDIVSRPEKQKTFIQSILSFLTNNRIDGVEIFWKWPTEPERFKYTDFLEELKESMRRVNQNFILSIVAPPAGIDGWENGFDLDGILQHVDFVNVLSMDYYGPWPSQWGTPAGPTAPLFGGINEKKNFNVDFTMRYYEHETKNPSKFNLVIPFFARLWRHDLGSLAPEMDIFRDIGLKNGQAEGNVYMTRCVLEREKWDISKATWDEETKSAYVLDARAKTYLTFETQRSIAAKIDYVKKMELGGVWIWAVNQDDDRYSLLNAVASHRLTEFGPENDNNFN